MTTAKVTLAAMSDDARNKRPTGIVRVIMSAEERASIASSLLRGGQLSLDAEQLEYGVERLGGRVVWDAEGRR